MKNTYFQKQKSRFLRENLIFLIQLLTPWDLNEHGPTLPTIISSSARNEQEVSAFLSSVTSHFVS